MFLGDIIERTLGRVETIAPRRASRFESPAEVPDPLIAEPQSIRQVSPREPERAPSPLALRVAPMRVEDRSVTERLPPQVSENAQARPAGETHPAQLLPPAATLVERTIAHEAAPPLLRSVIVPLPPSPQPLEPMEERRSFETIVRERTESRLETRVVERRFESLSSSTLVEPIADSPGQPLPAPPAPAVETPEAPSLPTQRATNIVPQVKLAPRERSPQIEMPAPVAPANVVQVTIGRVDVRATAPPAVRQQHRAAPVVALEEYLQRRERV